MLVIDLINVVKFAKRFTGQGYKVARVKYFFQNFPCSFLYKKGDIFKARII